MLSFIGLVSIWEASQTEWRTQRVVPVFTLFLLTVPLLVLFCYLIYLLVEIVDSICQAVALMEAHGNLGLEIYLKFIIMIVTGWY